jgi:hypothetical protein
LLVAFLALTLAAACGTEGDPVPLPQPACMWPIRITAGVNDAIDFSTGGGTYAATIAQATYYSPAELAAAVKAALDAAHTPTVFTVADTYQIDWSYQGTPYNRLLVPGVYTPDELCAIVVGRLEAATPDPTWEAALSEARVLTIDSNALAWTPVGASLGWTTLGFTSFPRAPGVTHAGDAAIPFVLSPWAVTVTPDGRMAISNVVPFVLEFSTGANASTSARYLLGFGAVDTALGTSATGANQIQNCWLAPHAVADDTGDLDEYSRVQTVSEAGLVKSLQYGTEKLTRAISFTHLPAHKVFIADEGASHMNEAIQRLIRYGWARFRWFPDSTDLETGADYALHIDAAKSLPRNRLAPGVALYSISLRMRRLVGSYGEGMPGAPLDDTGGLFA